MTPAVPPSEPPPGEPAEPAPDLVRSYGSVVGGAGAWELDVDPEAEPEAAPPGPGATDPAAAPPPTERIIEAVLFAGGAPITPERAVEVVRGLEPEQFLQAVARLNQDYRRQGRPYAIVSRPDGYVLALRPRYEEVVERLYGGSKEVRLSPAAVDVLALVAYRQPATKSEIDAIRGAESGALLRQLVRHGLIAVVRRGEAGRREVFYGTTERFLRFFRLENLDDLPRVQDLEQ